MDRNECMAVAEQTTLAMAARAVLARAIQDNPTVARLELLAVLEAGEIVIDVMTCDVNAFPVEGWGV